VLTYVLQKVFVTVLVERHVSKGVHKLVDWTTCF